MGNSFSPKFILTCEHATNRVPEQYAHLFNGADDILESHRGWDPGSIKIAHAINDVLLAPIFEFPFTRLLIEPNRSPHHPRLFSEFTRNLPEKEKNHLIDSFYKPYRQAVENSVKSLLSTFQTVIHLSIHTFTPNLNGSIRNMDIGLLYDPSHPREKSFCKSWKHSLLDQNSDIRVAMNRPYKGSSDGFTTTLRKKFGTTYLGIELEVNQTYFLQGNDIESEILNTIRKSILYVQFNESDFL